MDRTKREQKGQGTFRARGSLSGQAGLPGKAPANITVLHLRSLEIFMRLCIMATKHDLLAATNDPHNHEIYREQCELEIASTFSFQSNLWLSDLPLIYSRQTNKADCQSVKKKQSTYNH
jgi:hypothetical protein